MEKLKISTETKTLISSKPTQLENWFKEPILSIFYIYLLSNLLFAFFEISRGTLLGQYYLHMELHCYLFQLIIRSSWLKRSLIIVSLLAIIEYFFKKDTKKKQFSPSPDNGRKILLLTGSNGLFLFYSLSRPISLSRYLGVFIIIIFLYGSGKLLFGL